LGIGEEDKGNKLDKLSYSPKIGPGTKEIGNFDVKISVSDRVQRRERDKIQHSKLSAVI